MPRALCEILKFILHIQIMSDVIAGVGVLIKKDNKVLLGKRIHKAADNAWCFPGGHVDFFEHAAEAAIRETYEETGLTVEKLVLATYTDDIYKRTNQHFVTLVFTAGSFTGQLTLKEPAKFEKWEWFDWNELPTPLAEPMNQLLIKKFNPFI